MPLLSLNARAAMNAQHTGEVVVTLVVITHPDLVGGPVRLSSDPTQRLSLEPKLRYGTISNGHEYEFVLMTGGTPDDVEGSPRSVSFSFENVASDMASLIRSVLTPARVDMYEVFASDPDTIESQFLDFRGSLGRYDASRVTLEVGREAIASEQYPAHSMTQARFPGLYR